MAQENEVINLLMGLVSLPVLFLLARRDRALRLPLFYAGFFVVLSAYVFTIAENFLWFDFFNVLEHLALAIGGLLFCLALARLPRDLGHGRDAE